MSQVDHDILAPIAESEREGAPARIVAFIPVALALFGVGLILFGGVRAADPDGYAEEVNVVDPVVTGAIVPPRDHRRDLEMLDL